MFYELMIKFGFDYELVLGGMGKGNRDSLRAHFLHLSDIERPIQTGLAWFCVNYEGSFPLFEEQVIVDSKG